MIRLAKYIADASVCSRRGACRLIEAGEVKVIDLQRIRIMNFELKGLPIAECLGINWQEILLPL